MLGIRRVCDYRLRRLLAVALAITALAVACGSDGSADTADAGESSEEIASTAANEPAATSTPLVIETSTPLPSPTPLPTATAEPLTAPTASAVLLTTAFTNSSKVTTVGIDEVFFGMTSDDAAEAASTTWIELASSSGNCFRVTPADGPDGVTLWVVDGRVERLDIEHPDIRTPSQLGIGNSEAELQGQLGDRLTVNTDADGTKIATFAPTDPGDRDFRIVFELVDDRVVRYSSGRIGVIERQSAGC